MIYSLAKRQPRQRAKAGLSTAMEIESGNKSGTGDTLVPVAVTTSVEIEPPTGHPITYSSPLSTSYAIILFRFLAAFDNGTATPRP